MHIAFQRDYLLCLLLYDIEIMTDKLYDFMSAMGSSERGFLLHCIKCIAHADVSVHVLSSVDAKARQYNRIVKHITHLASLCRVLTRK